MVPRRAACFCPHRTPFDYWDIFRWAHAYNPTPTPQDNFLSGTVCIGITGLLLLLYLAAGLMLWLRRQRWDARRFRSYLTRMTELVAMLLLVAAWTVAGDGRRLERDCPKCGIGEGGEGKQARAVQVRPTFPRSIFTSPAATTPG